MKPGVRKFFRLCGYTPASCLSSWNLRSNQPFWPEASVADSREGGWPDTVFSLKVSIKLRAICRSLVVRLHGLVNLSGQYRESLIWESVQFCTDISGWEHATFEFYGCFVDGFLGLAWITVGSRNVRTLTSAPVFATSRLHVLCSVQMMLDSEHDSFLWTPSTSWSVSRA